MALLALILDSVYQVIANYFIHKNKQINESC